MRIYLTIVATPLLFALGFFLPYVGEPLALVGFLPLFWCLLKEEWSYKKSFFSFFLSGLVFFGATLAWMFSLMPLEWAGASSVWTAYGLFLPVYFVILFLFAFWWGVFGVGARYLLTYQGESLIIISLAGFWVLCEYARSFMVGFLGFSEAYSLLFSEWTFGSLVYAMTDGWMVLLASVGGLSLVNFAIMVCNVFIFLQCRRASTLRKKFLLGVSILLGTILFSVFCGLLVSKWHERAYRSAPSYKIAVMRTDISRAFSYSQDARVLPLRESIDAVLSLREKIDILVAPEDADVLSFDMQNGGRLFDRMKKDSTMLVDHSYERQASGLVSRTVYFHPDSGIFGFQGKNILMPIGEYVPYSMAVILKFLGYQYAVDNYQNARAVASSLKGPPITYARGTYGAIVCSEASNPNSTLSLVQAGANIIFLQSSDTLFRNNSFYNTYMLSMARVRAIESGRFVVRASNAGTTAIIDSLGRVRISKSADNGVITYTVPMLHILTPYVFLSKFSIF